MIKVVKFRKLKSGPKKYEITFLKNGKKYVRKFGAAGMSDFTIHKDKERRERYISRHKKDLKSKDPMKPGYLSMFILWNKPSLRASLADYKRRLGTYNRTGKFPIKITGSKKLKFGMWRKVREGIWDTGDTHGLSFLKSIGLDRDDRIATERLSADARRLPAALEMKEPFQMVPRLSEEMIGRRTDNKTLMLNKKRYSTQAVRDALKSLQDKTILQISKHWKEKSKNQPDDDWDLV